jgi:hypothetical protein
VGSRAVLQAFHAEANSVTQDTSPLKKNFRRHGSGPARIRISSEEATPLVSRNLSTISESWKPGLASIALNAAKEILSCTYLNILLVLVPVAVAGGAVGWSSTAVFALNFLAILPLAAILEYLASLLVLPFGEVIGGLLNVFSGSIIHLTVRGTARPKLPGG